MLRSVNYQGPRILQAGKTYVITIYVEKRPTRQIIEKLRAELGKYFTNLRIYAMGNRIVIVGKPVKNLEIGEIIPIIAGLLESLGVLLIAIALSWSLLTHPWVLVALAAVLIGGYILIKELEKRR